MTKKGWIPGCAMRQRNHPNCFLSQGDSVNHEKLRRGSIWRFRPIATRGVRLSDVPRPRRALSSLEDRDLHLGTRSAQAGWVSFFAPTAAPLEPTRAFPSSEEHTSELQSLMRISYAVF